MADPATPAPGEEAKGGGEEVDVVRATIYFLAILLAGLGVVYFVLLSKRDGYREAVGWSEKRDSKGERNGVSLAATYASVKGHLKEYEESRAEEALKNLQGWLKARYGAAEIQDNQVGTGKWSNRLYKDCVEWYVQVTVKNVPRRNAVQFVWNVERMSTKMRTIWMDLRRMAPNNQPEADVWELQAEFGYRVPRGMKEGG